MTERHIGQRIARFNQPSGKVTVCEFVLPDEPVPIYDNPHPVLDASSITPEEYYKHVAVKVGEATGFEFRDDLMYCQVPDELLGYRDLSPEWRRFEIRADGVHVMKIHELVLVNLVGYTAVNTTDAIDWQESETKEQ